MKWMLPITLISALLSGNTIAQNEWDYKAAEALAITAADSVSVEVIDHVSGGCMQPDGLERAAEVQLRRNNIKLADNFWTPILSISAVGFGTSVNGQSSGCVVSINVELKIMMRGVPVSIFPEPQISTFMQSIHLGGSLFTGDPMQKRLEDFVQDQVDELFLKIQRSKDFLDKNHPGILEKHRPLKDPWAPA